MAIRINSGWCRGLTLKSPPTLHTRPTASRTREAVWNSLQFEIQHSKIIDLFSGSGAVGFEAISRGASEAILVDNSFDAVKCLNYNAKQVLERARERQSPPKVLVHRGDALSVLSSQKNSEFDMIWADPPYHMVPEIAPELEQLAQKVLRPRGKIIFEYDQDGLEVLEKIRSSDVWQERKHKRYGKTFITILEKREINCE